MCICVLWRNFSFFKKVKKSLNHQKKESRTPNPQMSGRIVVLANPNRVLSQPRMIAKADTPSLAQAMCTVRGHQGF